MKKVTVNLYSFDELDEKAQCKVLNDTVSFLIDVEGQDESSDVWKACKKANDMQTPWFAPQYVMEECKEKVMSLARADLYAKNGEQCNHQYIK